MEKIKDKCFEDIKGLVNWKRKEAAFEEAWMRGYNYALGEKDE